jgi:hypothetical protein
MTLSKSPLITDFDYSITLLYNSMVEAWIAQYRVIRGANEFETVAMFQYELMALDKTLKYFGIQLHQIWRTAAGDIVTNCDSTICGSFPLCGKNCFSFPKRLDWLSSPLVLLNKGHQGIFIAGKTVGDWRSYVV